jgi:signal transduction histidine kinase
MRVGTAMGPDSGASRSWLRVLRRARAVCAVAVLLLPARDGAAQPQIDLSHWRFYSSVDGLRESWVEDISLGVNGRVWITHGSVDAMTLFDGYTFRRLPTPGANLTVREGPDSQVWAFHRASVSTMDGLQRFDDGRWEVFNIPALDQVPLSRNAFVPWARDRVLVVTNDRAAEFDQPAKAMIDLASAPATRLGTFLVVEPRRKGGAWLGGRGAIASIVPGPSAGSMDWTDQPLPAGLRRHDVQQISDLGDEGLYVTVVDADRRSAVIVLRDGRWRTLVRSDRLGAIVQAWSTAGETWIVTVADRTFRIEQTDDEATERRLVRPSRALSGEFHRGIVGPDGALWVASSLGLARHAPPLWQTPKEVRGVETHTSTLFESRSGDLFALNETVLLWRHDALWRRFAMPPGGRLPDFTDGIAELADGRIIFNWPTPDPIALLTFNPATEEFEWINHPRNRRMTLLAARGEQLWMRTWAGTTSWLEVSDARSFTPLYEPGARWSAIPPRGLLLASTGDIFVLPDQTGVGRLFPDGTYRMIGAADGFPGAGPFCGLEVAPGRYWFGDRDGVIELTGTTWRVLRSGMQAVRSLVRSRDGTIWAAANSGLHAYRQGSWIDMIAAEGMPDGAVLDVLQDRSGVMWAATSLGLVRLFENADRDPPETMLDPTLNPREVPPSGDMRLTFGGLDRWQQTRQARLLYSWRVDEGNWSPYSAESGASLRGLGAARHRIEVRAMDRNWNVDPTPALADIRVLLPWYREKGFLAVGITGLLALLTVVGLVTSRHLRLGRLVADRTRELDASNRQLRRELEDRRRVEDERARLETQLHQAQKLEAVGRLAGGIAHDFNNLLTVITSYGDMMREELPFDHPLKTAAVEVVRAAERASALTRQLLAFGRHQMRRTQPLDLNTVVADIERMLSRLIGEDIDLDFRPAAALARVVADRGQIEQVIVNLVVNARDAMPSGGKLTISTSNVDLDENFASHHLGATPGRYVLLSVTDTGVGMDTQTQERMFEPFFTTKARDKGTGLGLATVYGIVKQTGGHMWVYSEPGHGTTFNIYLPSTDAPHAEAATDVPAKPSGGTERVLLVEDDAAVRGLAATVLRSRGYTVIEAPSAEAAEGLLARIDTPVDLVLTDIVLTGMSGPQLAERLRSSHPKLRVLFMSGYADDAVVRHGLLESEVSFIQKPFTPQALARKVRETLDA